MKKFKFRLEAVERHRKLKEQEKQVWLSKCLEKMRSTERKLLDLDMKEVQARRDFAALGENRGKDKVNAAAFWMLDQFIEGQKIRRIELKQQLEEEENIVREAFREFLHARQQHKIMEKLREKSEAKYKEEQRKYERRQNDQLYTMRHRLAQREEV